MLKVIKTLKDPRWFIAILWPMVLAVPYLPGIPRPSLGGLAWRQELAFAILLVVTSAFLVRQQNRNYGAGNGPALPSASLLITGVLFTLWIAASSLWAANPYSAAHYAFTWGAYLLFFVLIRMVAARPRALRASFYALGLVVWLLSLSAIVEWLGGAALTDHLYRSTVKPLFRGFSGFGEVMAVATPIFGALALTVRNWRRAALCGATALIAWLVILQGYQRAPIVGVTAGLSLLGIGVLALRGCRPQSWRRAGLLLASLILVALAQLVISSPAPGELTMVQRLQTTSLSDDNTSVRILYWGVGLEMFRAHPLLGVGANNYEVAFSSARERFSATHPDSALVGMNEQLLTQYAHNEYVQILAELGLIGILLFSALCLLLARTFWHALRRARRPLPALGAGAGLLAFAVSSGASAFSFRWFGSGLMCFFAATIVSHFAEPATKQPQPETKRSFGFGRLATASAFGFAVLMFIGAGTQATNSVMHAWAQSSNSPAQAENFYRHAVRFNPYDAATHFDYGSLLYQQRRYNEAVPHFSYAVAHGFNTSTSYAALAAAQAEAGELAASEQTLAIASRAYPHSIFLLVRHAAALSRMGRTQESEQRFAEALKVDARAARGWYQLINFDIDAALAAAEKDSSLPKPGELKPQTAVFVVLKENERRLNIPAKDRKSVV